MNQCKDFCIARGNFPIPPTFLLIPATYPIPENRFSKNFRSVAQQINSIKQLHFINHDALAFGRNPLLTCELKLTTLIEICFLNQSRGSVVLSGCPDLLGNKHKASGLGNVLEEQIVLQIPFISSKKC